MDRMKIEFDAKSENEGFARVCVAAFATRLDPTLDEINDIKTAVSEAVTNCVIHAYEEKGGQVILETVINDKEITITITDFGKGIPDINKAMEPLFTTGLEKERSGMGFTFMEVFMDELKVESVVDAGTTVIMKKKIGSESIK